MNTTTKNNKLNKLKAVNILQNKVIVAYLMMIALYFISVVIAPNFLSSHHILQTLMSASILGIVAIGQNLIIISGGCDLSVSYSVNLAAVVMTSLSMDSSGIMPPIIVMSIGLFLGLISGFFVAYVKVPSIITTLAMGSILRSATYVYTDGTPVGSSPDWLSSFVNEPFMGLRGSIYLWIALTIAVTLLISCTSFGRKLYAVGSNQLVSNLSGINTKNILLITYALAGLSYALAGIIAVGYNGMSYLGMGETYEMSSIAAVVIGGTSILGGLGKYSGTVAGVILIYILNSILAVLEMTDAGKNIIYGLVILSVLIAYGRASSNKA